MKKLTFLAVVLSVMFLGCDSSPAGSGSSDTTSYSVKYEVTGNASSVILIYLVDGENPITKDSSLPWSTTFTADTFQALSVGFVSNDSRTARTITAKIYIDNEVEKTVTDPVAGQLNYVLGTQ